MRLQPRKKLLYVLGPSGDLAAPCAAPATSGQMGVHLNRIHVGELAVQLSSQNSIRNAHHSSFVRNALPRPATSMRRYAFSNAASARASSLPTAFGLTPSASANSL